jgi:hypothetical protein
VVPELDSPPEWTSVLRGLQAGFFDLKPSPVIPEAYQPTVKAKLNRDRLRSSTGATAPGSSSARGTPGHPRGQRLRAALNAEDGGPEVAIPPALVSSVADSFGLAEAQAVAHIREHMAAYLTSQQGRDAWASRRLRSVEVDFFAVERSLAGQLGFQVVRDFG